jgi:hypothetical protein
MRRSRSVRSAAVPLAVGAVLLAGCGASEEERRTESFCEDVPDLLDDVTAELQGATAAPDEAPALVGDAVERLEAVDPPQDAADEWQALVTAWSGMRDLLARAEGSDPSANAELVEEAERVQSDLDSAGTAVDDWGQAHC